MNKKYKFILQKIMLCLSCMLFIASCNTDTSEKSNRLKTDTTASEIDNSLEIASNSKSVKEFYHKQRIKKTEKFVFTNNKGFTYKGKGGTVLVFPANAFDCNEKDSVELEVSEFTDLTSIVQANLSTLSNGKMLESNGMVYCKAYSGNKELELKKGKSFKCMFNKPTSKNFKLFEGEDTNGFINWKNPTDEVVQKNNAIKTIKVSKIENSKKEALTICTYGTPNDINDIENSLKFTDNPSDHIISYFIDNYDIAFNDLIPFAPNESIMLNFTLTKSGRLKFIDSEEMINPKIKNKLINYFEKMPLIEGYTNAETGEKEDLPLYFAICPNKLLNERLENDKGNMTKVNQILASQEQQKKELQEEMERQEKIALEKSKREYELYEKNQAFSDKINESTKIVFKATKMGWINCDRFYNDGREKVALDFEGLEQFTSFNIQIVFPKINSVYALNSNNRANNIPIDETIKIVFVGMKNTDVFFCNKSVTTAKENKIQFAEATKIKESDLNSYIENSLN